MDFGYLLDESSSFDVMDPAVDAGINHFDTADVYGGPQAADMTKGYGVSEEVIGRWLQRSRRRDEIVLATKAYQPMGLGPNDRRLSAHHLRRACEASRRQRRASGCRVFFRPCRPAWSGQCRCVSFPIPATDA
jgi:aryl-alcohol dehydrogenase-like predicted oxidoreductase